MSVGLVAGRRCVVSCSGGKDSAAAALHLRELGIPFDLVFLDTGWEAAETYTYIRGPLTAALGPITEIRGELQMEQLIEKKGMFPSRVRRYCTEELKVFPMVKYLRARLDAGEQLVNVIGIRHEESAARAHALEWETSGTFGCDVWAPLVRWTLADVVAIHQRHGLAPNPLYLKGASRVGCWPCIFARKDELRLISERDPERIARIAAIETSVASVASVASVRHRRDQAAWKVKPDPEPPVEDEAKHRRWERKRDRLTNDFSAPTFFQTNDARTVWMPIAEVVRWSKTEHGGKQFPLFGATRNDTGCMRWGLCEGVTPPADGDRSGRT